MKTNIAYLYQSLWMALAGLLVTACEAASDSGLSFDSESIRVYTSMRQADTEGKPVLVGEDIRSYLIFWKEEAYKNMLNSTNAENWPGPPYLVAKPEYPIDYYAVKFGNPYDTKRSYPTGDDPVYVIGYAPAELTSDDNYRTLNIPDYMQNGKVDFLSGDGSYKRKGSASNPFVTGQNEQTKEEKQLEFCHLTAKINFEAKRVESMAQKIGVQNVKVTLKGQKIPAKLEWKTIDDKTGTGGYFPTPMEKPEILLEAPENEKVVLDINQKVDSCYVYADGDHFHTATSQEKGTITLTMDISAELLPFKNGTWDESQATTRKWENLEVKIESKTGNELKMGYAYKVIITFDVWDIRLQGMEVDWYNGGLHYIPITPVEQQ